MGDLEYIAKSCKEDKRLLKILKDVANMTKEEKEEFSRKVRSYFMDKNSEEDSQAYRFFKIVLENNNAERILKILGDD
ncbi:hypothetical protein SU69_05330 [Thermosipho melanesiensis]|uniref:Uncharacterized protein n=2 Tax=Thermosipho melanesiensis TaxID=46541 RepID=A6LLV1_THEM4|nr:hypothetical protein [Thermosipho melanesiensis]ABR30902.1 hypothetical protein Tmel_1041 [Thermosipho melanesiensis BI429]APT74021.1 hypothetical protein BW47_05570 [Thermosipho melanesiensis]OOC35949.1 hypothetical protein SU68_05385 [Thermosipho melanesiensis]OOC38451.1 hypothetical protein SU69_05330 [Thermosipho melanesiensis]OOC38912.1 hypothetical protein SU70_05330 [Thermosipho melanesiensis]